jgi:3-hydroxyacyl-CoA dehydrogenase/enoyl-CoA hydratase/3-hydroxybutyryl-CoA epimerase
MQNAFHMIEEGAKPETIDAAMEAFGMPMGPAELADTVGLDICLAAGKALAKNVSSEADVPEVLAKNVALGHLGKKTGQGIYRYQDGKPGGKAIKGRPDTYPPSLIDALIEPYLQEAKEALAEGIVADADLVDAGLIFGTGFAPFRGGPLHYLNSKKK